MDASYLFAKNFVNTKYENLPPEVVEATKKEILDLLGVALGGLQTESSGAKRRAGQCHHGPHA
jgi:2-methylcitrate dehydratase PrpD